MTDINLPPETVDTSSAMRCYALLGLGMPLALAPMPVIAGIGFFAVMIGIVWAYRIRQKPSAGDLLYNHGRWMVRTFWISSLYMMIAMVLSSSIISSNADKTAIEGMAKALETGALSPQDIAAMVHAYLETNRTLMTVTTLICFGPIVFFVLARFFIGYRLAEAGRPIGNIKTWLIR
jgi:uncharacterized membrane protein